MNELYYFISLAVVISIALYFIRETRLLRTMLREHISYQKLGYVQYMIQKLNREPIGVIKDLSFYGKLRYKVAMATGMRWLLWNVSWWRYLTGDCNYDPINGEIRYWCK